MIYIIALLIVFQLGREFLAIKEKKLLLDQIKELTKEVKESNYHDFMRIAQDETYIEGLASKLAAAEKIDRLEEDEILEEKHGGN